LKIPQVQTPSAASQANVEMEEHILDVPMEDPHVEPAHVEPSPAPVGKAAESEFEVDQDFDLILEPEPLVPAHEQRPPEIPVVPLHHAAASKTPSEEQSPSKVFASDQFLSDLAKEIDELGLAQ